MNRSHLILLSALLYVLQLPALLNAQSGPPLQDSIFSSRLNEQRKLRILLPEGYKPGSPGKYDVLYLLDGEWNSGLVLEVQTWLKQWGFTPPIVIVGIENSYPNNNNQRGRDLTPTATPGSASSGGGPAFLSFIKNELVPYINKTYPSNGSNIIFGHSLGGLFVLYALFSEPQLFNAYVAADPSIWWDNGFILKLANVKLKELKEIKSLFMTGRTGRAYHEMKIDSMDMVLRSKAPANLQWKTMLYPDETHISQQYKSAYDGLKFSLAPLFRNDRIHLDPMGGIVLKNKPFSISCYNVMSEKNIRYTTDGSSPQLSSAAFTSDNTVSLAANSVLHIKSFFVNEADDKMTTADFAVGKSLIPLAKPGNITQGTLNYACYKDAGNTQKISSGIITPDKNINQLADADSFFCRISGYFETTEAGYYTFEISGGEGTKLYIGDKLLIDIPAKSYYQSFIIPLGKGFYPIRFEYMHQKGGANFDFGYVVPGATSDSSIPPSLMYYVP